MLHPDEKCTKTGSPVLKVLESKHPPLQNPTTLSTKDGVFEPYNKIPTKLPPLSVTQHVMETIGAKLSGAAGPGETDGKELKTWLLRYGISCSKGKLQI